MTPPAPSLALPILVRTDAFVIVDKPSGLSVHRGWDGARDHAMGRLRDQLGQWVYPVHRLDRGTSGCLAFALSEDAARALNALFAAHVVHKTYVALVRGALKDERGTVDYAIPREEDGPRVDAVTDFERLAVLEGGTLVVCWPRTGRLHQIRRHFRHLGHPLLGDTTWGDNKANKRMRERGLHRLALHALALSFPFTGSLTGASGAVEVVRAVSPLPDDLASPLSALGLDRDAQRSLLAAVVDRDASSSGVSGKPPSQ